MGGVTEVPLYETSNKNTFQMNNHKTTLSIKNKIVVNAYLVLSNMEHINILVKFRLPTYYMIFIRGCYLVPFWR